MDRDEILTLIGKMLAQSGIYSVNTFRSNEEPSQYFGRYRSDMIQIRVSDHVKPYLPQGLEINILVRQGMSRDEVEKEVVRAVRELTEEENKLAESEGIA